MSLCLSVFVLYVCHPPVLTCGNLVVRSNSSFTFISVCPLPPSLPYAEEKKRLSEDPDSDFFEYTRGKKIPPEGIPGFDFSDPESIVEFTKYACEGGRGVCVCGEGFIPGLCSGV